MTPVRRPADPRWVETQRRHEAARLAVLRRDASRSIGENIEEGARLVLAATTMARDFAAARR